MSPGFPTFLLFGGGKGVAAQERGARLAGGPATGNRRAQWWWRLNPPCLEMNWQPARRTIVSSA